MLKTEKDKDEAKHEEEKGELLEKHSKELQDNGQSVQQSPSKALVHDLLTTKNSHKD